MKKLFTKTFLLGIAFLLGGYFTTSAQGSGTFENPYTINYLLAMDTLQTTEPTDPYVNVWVEGYIVGALEVNFGAITNESWVRSDFVNTTSINTNIVLGQTAGETNFANIVPVQLPLGGVMREQINLKDNPSNYRAHIKVQGNIARYFQVNGVRDTKGLSGEFVIEPPVTTGIGTNVGEKGLIVSTDGSNLIVSVEKSASVSVYSTLGQLVYSGVAGEGQNIIPLTKGQVYIVKAGAGVAKVIL